MRKDLDVGEVEVEAVRSIPHLLLFGVRFGLRFSSSLDFSSSLGFSFGLSFSRSETFGHGLN